MDFLIRQRMCLYLLHIVRRVPVHVMMQAELRWIVIDQHSRVYVKNTNSLRNLGYATPYLPGKGNPPQIPSSNKGDDVRFYAHAVSVPSNTYGLMTLLISSLKHAGVMQYSTWMNWIGQSELISTRRTLSTHEINLPLHTAITPGKKGEKMPNYIQIGEMHL